MEPQGRFSWKGKNPKTRRFVKKKKKNPMREQPFASYPPSLTTHTQHTHTHTRTSFRAYVYAHGSG